METIIKKKKTRRTYDANFRLRMENLMDNYEGNMKQFSIAYKIPYHTARRWKYEKSKRIEVQANRDYTNIIRATIATALCITLIIILKGINV